MFEILPSVKSVGQSKQRIAVGKPMATDGGCVGNERGSPSADEAGIVLNRFFPACNSTGLRSAGRFVSSRFNLSG